MGEDRMEHRKDWILSQSITIQNFDLTRVFEFLTNFSRSSAQGCCAVTGKPQTASGAGESTCIGPLAAEWGRHLSSGRVFDPIETHELRVKHDLSSWKVNARLRFGRVKVKVSPRTIFRRSELPSLARAQCLVRVSTGLRLACPMSLWYRWYRVFSKPAKHT